MCLAFNHNIKLTLNNDYIFYRIELKSIEQLFVVAVVRQLCVCWYWCVVSFFIIRCRTAKTQQKKRTKEELNTKNHAKNI